MTFVRYVLVQLLAYALDLGSFEILVHFGVMPVVANLASKVPAGAFAFVAHRAFTFGVRDPGRTHVQAVRYFTLLALNAPLSSLILAGLLTVIANVTVAKISADILSVGLTFLLTKYVVFGTRSRSAADDASTRGTR